jgi:ACT domain-containing protein
MEGHNLNIHPFATTIMHMVCSSTMQTCMPLKLYQSYPLHKNELVTLTINTTKIKMNIHGVLDKLKSRIGVQVTCKIKEAVSIEDTYSPSTSCRVLTMFLADAAI